VIDQFRDRASSGDTATGKPAAASMHRLLHKTLRFKAANAKYGLLTNHFCRSYLLHYTSPLIH